MKVEGGGEFAAYQRIIYYNLFPFEYEPKLN